MIDAKPDENDLPPIQLAAALARGESHWRNLAQAAAYIRDAESSLAAETKRADEAEAECKRWLGLCEMQQKAVRATDGKRIAAEQARDEAVVEVVRLEWLAHSVKEFLHPQEWKFHQPSYKPGLAAKIVDLAEAANQVFGEHWQDAHESNVAALLQPKEAEGGK